VNGDTVVTEATRKIVEQAIAALDFIPSPLARALSGAQQIRVGLLHRFPNAGSLGEYLVHLLDVASKAHASLVVREIADLAKHEATIDEIAESGVQGVILSPPLADVPGLLDALFARRIAVVATGSNRQTGRIVSVGIDDQEAARAMTLHLLRSGHTRIGFICGDPRFASAGLRLSGFRNAMREAGVRVADEMIAQGNYTYQSGLIAAEQLIGCAERPTAIFASNDDMAAATVAVAHRRRLDIPQDLSVCGFDDAVLATTISPELTTIGRPVADITRAAFRTLVAQVTSDTVAGGGLQVFGHKLIRRQSDGPPPSRTTPR